MRTSITLAALAALTACHNEYSVFTNIEPLEQGCSLSPELSLTENFPPIVRLSYEAGENTMEAENDDQWQEDSHVFENSGIGWVGLNLWERHGVYPESTVRFLFETDMDSERNGNEVPTHELSYAYVYANWEMSDEWGRIYQEEELDVMIVEIDDQLYYEVDLPACEH